MTPALFTRNVSMRPCSSTLRVMAVATAAIGRRRSGIRSSLVEADCGWHADPRDIPAINPLKPPAAR